jgi:hypothetical protein
MKRTKIRSILMSVKFVTICLGLASCDNRPETDGTTPTPETESQVVNRAQSEIGKLRREAEQQTRPEIETRRREIEQETEKTIDKEAITAIDETRRAIKAINENKKDEALEAIAHATGKIDILLARNPATALIPAAYQVEVIDAAPADIQAVKERAKSAERAVDDKDYPAARLMLYGLTSEIHKRTYNLPLITYQAALRDAARLVEQTRNDEASRVLLKALNTLVAIDRVTPLPLVFAEAGINEAQELRERDRNRARELLSEARREVERAKELGYTGNDPEYADLNRAISDLERHIEDDQDTASYFSSLLEKTSAFFKRQSESDRR